MAPYKTYTYRVYPTTRGGRWDSTPWQRGDGYGGLWKSRPFQRGDGLGSLFGRIARKILPIASKAAKRGFKSIKNSQKLKQIGNTILDKSVAGITEIAANAIEGGNNNRSAAETAQQRLDSARRDIANIIRRKGETGNDSATDEDSSDYSLDNIPIIKRKRPKAKTPQRKAKRKKYNMLKNIKNDT